MQLVLISGLSGSGKSIALNALEDSGYYCVDNLPGQLLQQSAELLRSAGHNHVAMSIDARMGDSLELVPEYVAALKAQGVDLRLRPLTGLDAEVVAFLEKEPKVGTMLGDILRFVETWLPAYGQDNRSTLTVAVGCTGGRHRSVYLVERLGAYFRSHTPVLVRHRHLVPAG